MSKIRFFAPVLLCLVTFTAGAADAVDPALGSYQWYTSAVDSYCKASDAPWSDAISNSLLKTSFAYYPDLFDTGADQKYLDLVSQVKGDPTQLQAQIQIEQQDSAPIASAIEKSSDAYAERMDAIYDCAAYNAMLRAQKYVLNSKEIPLSGNFAADIQRKNDALSRALDMRQCRNISALDPSAEVSFKKNIVDSTTLEYCNYRHYLYYVDTTVKTRLGHLVGFEAQQHAVSTNGSAQTSYAGTDHLADQLAGVASRAEAEIARVKAVYLASFDAYSEFERNYASHVLSLAITAELVTLRDRLDATMNPIGQLIYAGSNAQSPGN